MATKIERSQIKEVLSELKAHRGEVQDHGTVLARLDERTLQIQTRMDRLESRSILRAGALAALVTAVLSPIIAIILNAVGWPRA